MKSILLLGAASLVEAHYGLIYPEWRFDTLSDKADAAGYSQWIQPCAGVPTGVADSNRTEWPLTGGSLKLDLHHPWTYLFVNLGIGGNVTNFNVTLTPEFLNVTGSGTLCLPKLDIPEGTVKDGELGSLQVVTTGETGSGLYNCADLKFSASASPLLDSECATDNGIAYYAVTQQSGDGNHTHGNGDDNGSSTQDDAAAGVFVSLVALTSMVGVATTFALGLF